MNGLDLVARKSLERTSEGSLLISNSVLNCSGSDSQEHWSWKDLKEQFCVKNADSLFAKYESRLQHTLFMVALTINMIVSVSSTLMFWLLSHGTPQETKVPLSLRITSASLSFLLYVLSYQERWFLGTRVRTCASSLVLAVTVVTEMGTSVYRLARGGPVASRFTAYPLLVATAFLPFPRWYQVGVAAAIVTLLELLCSGVSYHFQGNFAWKHMLSDVIFYAAFSATGMYIRFLMEFTNRKAFLDRRECFENKFRLDYEKEQEEQLLLSVLPKHISVQVRECIRDVIRRLNQNPVPQRPFTELFVEKHRNISILYADIVNSVSLTDSLQVSDLFETLNELVGRFDDSAEKHSCLRIKLLGDCYYCVTGMPNRDPLHADHCVQMGLDMIEIIRSFREESQINVDMRIGVHSGNVLSGLLGLRKWQFDIWSRDVTIASRMEQSGRPGCVHISRATLDLLRDKYLIEPANGNTRDEYLEKLNMETFYILPHKKLAKKDTLYVPAVQNRSPSTRRLSIQARNRMLKKMLPETEVLSSRRRTVLGFSLMQFRQMVSKVNAFMETAIDTMALSKKDQWFHGEGIQPLFLTFEDKRNEEPYLNQKDPIFKYSLFAVLLVILVICILNALIKPHSGFFWVLYGVSLLIIFVCVLFAWLPIILEKLKRKPQSKWMFRVQNMFVNAVYRTVIFLFLYGLLIVSTVTGLNCCVLYEDCVHSVNETYYNQAISCHHPWYFTWCAVLTMLSVSVFLRVHFAVKFMLHASIVTIASLFIRARPTLLNKVHLQDWNNMPPATDQYWCLFVTWCALHLLDRQVEYIGRLDYLWKQKLKKEQDEAATMGLVNKTLLQNILPFHVAQYYLSKESMHLELGLYHEEYKSVAVMFASIPNYMDFYSESFLNDEGRKCLQVLHEIICDFDKLLYDPPFLKLEKIKTIGSTYMAAAGLQPGRNSSRSSYESNPQEEENVTQNVMVLVKFAFAIMEVLEEINRHSWQQFHLRIGIDAGPVLAGVVGISKPQYDIWGNAVNLASRMESTGVVGAIQVTEQVASILKQSSKYDVECRGGTFVKGKGFMTTYLLYPPKSTKL